MERARLDDILRSGGLALPSDVDVHVTGADPVLAARFPVGEVAAAALAARGAQAAHLWTLRGGAPQSASVDVRAAAASLLNFLFLRVDGDARPRRRNEPVRRALPLRRRPLDPPAAPSRTCCAALSVSWTAHDAASIGAAVRAWDTQALEDALAERGMRGAMVRTAEEWRAHPQGRALAGVPAVEIVRIGDADPRPLGAGAAPLDGVRVLDLTRVLAALACGRTLAQHGADVLHVSSPRLPTIDVFDIDGRQTSARRPG
jgi:hypothetical protein